jgi:hypothetical protein
MKALCAVAALAAFELSFLPVSASAAIAPAGAEAQTLPSHSGEIILAARVGGGGGIRGGGFSGGGRNVRSSANSNINHNGNFNRNVNGNFNRNTNINVNRNVNVNNNIHGSCYGGCGYYHGWDNYHPVATAAVIGATAAVTAAAIGSIVYTVPSTCVTTIVNGFSYYQCGSTWYQPRYAGTTVQYVIVGSPR